MKRHPEARIGEIAARQHGVITRAQLLGAGLGASAITRRLSSGMLQRLHRGVYRLGPLESRETRAMAAILACGANAVVSHWSAASAWGAFREKGDTRKDVVDIAVDRTVRGPRRPGIRVHRVPSFAPDERTVHHRIPITTPGRTIIDLAGLLETRKLEEAVARLERKGILDREKMASLVERHEGRTGMPALRAVLERAGGPAFIRSEAESTFLDLVRSGGLPAPDINAPLGPYEIDFLWREEGVAVEIDGFRYHSPRASFEGDRRKDRWLLSQGMQVIRLSWSQVAEEPVATAVQVTRALDRARR